MRARSTNRASRLVGIAAVAAALSIGVPVASAQTPAGAPNQIDTPNANAYPRIELLTMGIGALIWERHGHIALCVHHDPKRVRCYNYGVANFGDPVGMGISFFRGKKSFWVGADSRPGMLEIYRRADRTIWSQLLPLTMAQKRRVIEKLQFDVKKENRYYAYDHFFDNCTTRVRDVIDNAMDGELKKLADSKDIGDATIRDYARKGFYGMRWALLTTDFFMGRVTDQKATYWDRLFLPEYVREMFEVEYGIKPVVIYQRKGPPHPEGGPSGRFILFLIILLLTAPAWATRLWGRFERAGMFFAVFIPGLLGLILWIGVIGSPVGYVRWTEAFFILVPFDFALPFLKPKLARAYGRVRVAILIFVSLLLAIGVFKQPMFVILLWPLIPNAVAGFYDEAIAMWKKKRAESDD